MVILLESPQISKSRTTRCKILELSAGARPPSTPFNIIKPSVGSTGSRFFIEGGIGILNVDPTFRTRIPLFGPGSHPDPTPDPTF